jgi:hypothetical protein
MPEGAVQSREQLLAGLFGLMAKAPSIVSLDKDRIERIKQKYRKTSDERIRAGIKMLEEDIKKSEEQAAKAKASLYKNVEERKRLKAIEVAERTESAKHAAKLLEQIGAPTVEKKKHPLRGLLLSAAIVVALAAAWYFLIYARK